MKETWFWKQIGKVEYDIAYYKYSFLFETKHISLLFDSRITEFVSSFECSLTQEEYKHLSRRLSIQEIDPIHAEYIQRMSTLLQGDHGFRNVEEDLNNLSSKRTDLKQQLAICQGKIDEQNKLVEEQKAKIIRLENALVNPNQITS